MHKSDCYCSAVLGLCSAGNLVSDTHDIQYPFNINPCRGITLQLLPHTNDCKLSIAILMETIAETSLPHRAVL